MKQNLLAIIVAIATSLIASLFPAHILAQDFQVVEFRDLPNDISAFINPVKDLNDEGCALLKVVVSSPDFAFSTPLGIAKRIDKEGEIWLYLPRGSKKITLKHPAWGVLRDYMFPSRLESHKTYELNIKEPIRHEINTAITPIVTTIRDTVVLTKVDTLIVPTSRPLIPLEADALLTAGIGGKATYLTWGFMIAVMKRHGGFLHISTDFGNTGALSESCDRHGLIDGKERYYSGQTKRKAFMATAGAAHRAGQKFVIFEGIGYSSTALAWQLAASEGGQYVKNSYFSSHGVTAEVGLMFRHRRVCIEASVLTIKGTEWFGNLGIGIRLGNINSKRDRHEL